MTVHAYGWSYRRMAAQKRLVCNPEYSHNVLIGSQKPYIGGGFRTAI